jgi:hypothetical protein
MSNSSVTILPSVYLGPVQWHSKLFLFDEILIDESEHYQKQTWRNRCRIAGANGIQDLIIPVHLKGNHTPMNHVEIDYDGNWQRQHWQSIRSAYGNSPFFNFYADHFSSFYHEKKWEFLVDYNSYFMIAIMDALKWKSNIKFTRNYFSPTEIPADFRQIISPKKNAPQDLTFQPKRYVQVFEDRHGFIPNLSIIDLLCCCGPESKNYL